MRARLAVLRWRWRQIPSRTRLGLLIAVVAIAGLVWQHDAAGDTTASDTSAAQVSHDGHDHGDDGHAHGEYQPDPATMAAPPDFSPEAARATAERFASNFASPNGNHDDWLARLAPDVMPELLDQYRLTDVRNIPQTVIAEVNGPMASDPAVPTFQVVYGDGARIETTLEMDVEGWKVSSVVPIDTATPQPAPVPSPEMVAPALAATPVSENG